MEEADEVIVLDDPEKFKGAVGLHYAAFGQVDDDEVIGLLHSSSLLAR
jgi:predicted phosphoribosyltransferase